LQERRVGSRGYTGSELETLPSAVDKLDRQSEAITAEKLKPIGVSEHEIREWIAIWNKKIFEKGSVSGNTTLAALHDVLHDHLLPRGLLDYVSVDFSIVRGLAYYTGIVFEVFDRSGKFRAIAGGGRYDNLIEQLSDAAVSMPALGFAMGDVVLGELINEIPAAREKLEAAVCTDNKIDIFVVIAKEGRRADALAQIQQLRERGYRADYPLTPTKVPKQFQTAEQLGARIAILFGDEWPSVAVKNLTTGEQQLVPNQELLAYLVHSLSLSS
jgi:histidyl-tRNA synthetase